MVEVAVRRLNARAPSPRALIPDLDPRWERAISRCLEREPEKRFAAAGDVVSGLRAQATQRTISRRSLATAIAVAAASIVAGATWWALRPEGGPPAAARPALAVLGLRNLSDKADTAWIGTALPSCSPARFRPAASSGASPRRR